jgi:predicted metal-dependent enzyme (double-stranded beta helix superfamily)
MTTTPRSKTADSSAAGALRTFVGRIAALVDSTTDEGTILDAGGTLLAELVRRDDWLPGEFALPDTARYRQYLLHCDSRERFSVVSFVWGPGQSTPIHDHTVWGLVGVLRGAEREERYSRSAAGTLSLAGAPEILKAGTVGAVSPRVGDVHRVANAYADRTSISIHVYGANIGAVERSTYEVDGTPRRFVSGYANRLLPNLWDRSGSA